MVSVGCSYHYNCEDWLCALLATRRDSCPSHANVLSSGKLGHLGLFFIRIVHSADLSLRELAWEGCSSFHNMMVHCFSETKVEYKGRT